MVFRIFQLGTNNWQSAEEFAPGSGILHAAHHATYNNMPDTKCWSIFPSKRQKSTREDVRVFPLTHDIPICESISPVSNYRWHSMDDAEFNAYRQRLTDFTLAYMDEIEAKEGAPFDLVVAHHTFLNPLVMRDVLRARKAKSGRAEMEKLVVFVHGTALKMYQHEIKGANPQEYPNRFHPMICTERVFDSVCGFFAISADQVGVFKSVFGEELVSSDRVVVSPNGIDTNLFKPNPELVKSEVLSQLSTVPAPGSAKSSVPVPTDCDKLVVFVGKYADWKRLDAVLKAAGTYEAAMEAKGSSVATLIVGTGPEDKARHYEEMVDSLELKHTYIVGPHQHAMLSQLFNVADVGVFPSKNEPMGLVFIECMACGTPVIGADSGGPRDFVDEKVGVLVEECQDKDHFFDQAFCDRLSESISESLTADWKAAKGEACVKRAHEKYGLVKQCSELIEAAKKFPVAKSD